MRSFDRQTHAASSDPPQNTSPKSSSPRQASSSARKSPRGGGIDTSSSKTKLANQVSQGRSRQSQRQQRDHIVASPVQLESISGEFLSGDEIQAKWGDEWFSAHFIGVADGGNSYEVEWDDGGMRTEVPVSAVRRRGAGNPPNSDPDRFAEPRKMPPPKSTKNKSPKATRTAHRRAQDASQSSKFSASRHSPVELPTLNTMDMMSNEVDPNAVTPRVDRSVDRHSQDTARDVARGETAETRPPEKNSPRVGDRQQQPPQTRRSLQSAVTRKSVPVTEDAYSHSDPLETHRASHSSEEVL